MAIERTCIVCEKKLRPSFTKDDSFDCPPSDAVVFQSWGNYGSCVFDPLDGNQYLEIFCCDECLVKKQQSVFHVIKDSSRSFKQWVFGDTPEKYSPELDG